MKTIGRLMPWISARWHLASWLAFIVASTIVLAGCKSGTSEMNDDTAALADGAPFGEINDSDIERLAQVAKSKNYHLESGLEKISAGDAKALARFLQFSSNFVKLDQDARTYGQLLFNTLLEYGEGGRIKIFSSALLIQTPEVRQRVRDFLYFPSTLVPEKQRRQVAEDMRKQFPQLFPSDYNFGVNDPLFKPQ